MKVVIAPDSFKESLTAQEVCEAVKEGLSRVWPQAEYVLVPVADGGEGTVQSLVDATGGELIYHRVTGPLNQAVDGFYGWLGDGKTAVVEVAAASGLHHVPPAERDAKITTSYGTGELILRALDRGAQRLIIGLGGSATNDGGVGLLAALGVRFLDSRGEVIPLNGAGLASLVSIDTSGLDRRLSECEILVACDVDNPLCGEKGASAVFGPQKGATPDDVFVLDQALNHYGQLSEQVVGFPFTHVAGTGAAGGIGAALIGYLRARLQPGIQIVLETVRLSEQLDNADLVITGEGRIDGQTVYGKTPMGVAQLAKQFKVPVIALAGCSGEGYQAVYEKGIDAVFVCIPRAMPLEEALAQASENLSGLAENVARVWDLSRQG